MGGLLVPLVSQDVLYRLVVQVDQWVLIGEVDGHHNTIFANLHGSGDKVWIGWAYRTHGNVDIQRGSRSGICERILVRYDFSVVMNQHDSSAHRTATVSRD